MSGLFTHRYMPASRRGVRFFILLLSASGLSACGSPKMECGSESGRAAIVKAVDNALNTQNCEDAVIAISPFASDPACATDEIRFARAAAYACIANVNFFQNVVDFGSSSSGPFETITKLFPSTSNDSKVISAEYALDALFSIRVPGKVTPPQYLIHTGTPNPGTLVASHRKDDSNIYGIFASMALMGALQNRYGTINASYRTRRNLGGVIGDASSGWVDENNITEDACAYAGATLTLIDNIMAVGSLLGSTFGGNVGTTLASLVSTVNLDSACAAAGCGLTECPTTLRYRGSCSISPGPNTEACAAAAIIRGIHAVAWPVAP